VSYTPPLFRSFFLAGFECSSHRRRGGYRVDVVAQSRHDELAAEDYARCAALDLRTVRDGVRWHRVERRPGHFDFSEELPRVRAARDAGVQVIWDLWHYGTPDHLDVFSPAFPERLARFARAFAEVVAGETDAVPFYCPVNEPSFVAWAGGSAGWFDPFRRGRGPTLKRQLVRANIAACEALWAVDPRARLCQIDPVIHITADPARPRDRRAAEGYRRSMFQAWDMLAGRLEPGLGGHPKYLDVVGVNLYDRNQWVHNGPVLRPGDALYRPFREILAEVHTRYGRPVFVAETGVEFDGRPAWLAYVGGEVRAALDAGVPVEGVCWYPILNHPGWEDDRHLQCGLWDYADANGHRDVHGPLLAELRRQQRLTSGRLEGAAHPVPPAAMDAASGRPTPRAGALVGS
jgi:hypothetical protein